MELSPDCRLLVGGGIPSTLLRTSSRPLRFSLITVSSLSSLNRIFSDLRLANSSCFSRGLALLGYFLLLLDILANLGLFDLCCRDPRLVADLDLLAGCQLSVVYPGWGGTLTWRGREYRHTGHSCCRSCCGRFGSLLSLVDRIWIVLFLLLFFRLLFPVSGPAGRAGAAVTKVL